MTDNLTIWEQIKHFLTYIKDCLEVQISFLVSIQWKIIIIIQELQIRRQTYASINHHCSLNIVGK